MANPRRTSLQLHQQNPTLPFSDLPPSPSPPCSSVLSAVAVFLKRPQAFPILLSVFVLLTWLSLRLQSPGAAAVRLRSPTSPSQAQGQGADIDANLVRFSAVEFPSQIAKDWRGWLLNPVVAAREAGIHGGALDCALVHVGQIRPGGMRGNHRHNSCNETFIIWGAETVFRLENAHVKDKGYAEVSIGVDEVAVAASPSGTAHALINVDRVQSTFILGCQDCLINNTSTTDYNVWKDL
ncbi:uncharacterized protein LOC103722963 [Phoenix dactylifera]|uniref:Uncharacterized protein LOC103722963 n=1 Tax=Phoenix dactylifera TaxID=42345 RepID=A0A8B7D2P6_PHODC|nr:uncharacterized protein LOC103722963 [Phoenix dactylifera]